MKLGKLEKINDLRTVWSHEARDFTNWLAEDENLKQLGEELGIEIGLIDTEVKTGSFNADILAKEENTEDKIIIENQLEQTNHDHLGKLLTYASGQDAKYLIWIVKDAREEHRQAVDWLNEHLDDEINIFLCKIELWRIDDSNLAPKFQIISRPNNWMKTIKKENNLKSEINLLQINYWTKLKEYLDENTKIKTNRKPTSKPYFDISIGVGGVIVSLKINTQNNEIASQIYISDDKELYDYLYGCKDEIEEKLGFKLEWYRGDGINASKIPIVKKFNINDEETWDDAIKWQMEKAEKLYEVFPEKIQEYKNN